MNNDGSEKLLLVSHLRLRRILGILGIALPVVVAVWGFALSGWSLEFQDTIGAVIEGLPNGSYWVGVVCPPRSC